MFYAYLAFFYFNLLFVNCYQNRLTPELLDELLNEIFTDELSEEVQTHHRKPFDLAIKLKRDFEDDLVSDLFATSYNLEKIARVNEFHEDNSLFQFKLKDDTSHSRRHKRAALQNTIETIQNDDRVQFVIPQPYLKRDKRPAIDVEYREFSEELKKLLLKDKTKTHALDNDVLVASTQLDKDLNFNDLYFNKEWYLINKGQLNTPSGHDLNIKDAWLKGYTGKGINIVIVDDGLDHTHPDLKLNYKPEFSYDYNDENDTEHDPMPSTLDNQNNHGTKCAGAAAANGNNTICGVGIAYNANIGGIRILDGPVTDLLEARALLFKARDIHIKSASWGPRDDGAHMEYPGIFLNHALDEGVRKGRNGLGTIFIWASGNGGANDDDCSCDGYVSNWNVISIGSVNYNGRSPFYMERCPSTMAVVYTGGTSKSNDNSYDPGIRVVTSDVAGKCTTSFQGTSAAAPLAAGAIALLLEANPNVTYRDVMYLIARTSRIPNIEVVEDSPGWIVNSAGYHVNEMYGFGVMDVGQLVQEAQKWKNVGERFSCFVEYDGEYPEIRPVGITRIEINVKSCENVEQLEHVVANISFKYSTRGDLKLTLVSPANTPSEILSFRKNDFSNKGTKHFPFMTLFNWGESPIGKWTLIIESKSRNDEQPNWGRLEYFALKLFGTTVKSFLNADSNYKENDKIVSRFLNRPDTSFIPTFDELKNIYVEEKKLSRQTRIIERTLLETNPELRNTILSNIDEN